MSDRRNDIINELEKEYGVECDSNFDGADDVLCNHDGCRHSECDCWDDFKSTIKSHLEDQVQKKRVRGSLTVWELREILRDAICDPDAPVFINRESIDEAWGGSDEFNITTRGEQV